MSNIIDRFSSVDRQLKTIRFQLKLVSTICVASVGGFLYMLALHGSGASGSSAPTLPKEAVFNEVRAKRIIVLDQEGQATGQLSELKGSTVLFFFKNGVITSKYGINPQGRPFMTLYDQSREARFSLGLDKSESLLMTFNDTKGSPRLQVRQAAKDDLKMDLFDGNRKKTRSLVK